MKKDLFLAIDEGTTGVTVSVVDEKLKWVATASVDFKQYFPKPGWVEHQPEEIWKAIVFCIKSLSRKTDLKKIAAIGITNQRETVCFWEKQSLRSLGPALVWQDRRTASFCEKLKKKNLEKEFQRQTGLLLDPYFSGTKISWTMENFSKVGQARKRGTLQIGTIDSYVLARLTGGKSYCTEPSNASRTLLFDIHKMQWDSGLARALQIPHFEQPRVLPSFGKFGVTRGVPGIQDGTPITGILGDQQSALLGQACIEKGSAKCTYGTGAFILMNTGRVAVSSTNRLLTTVAWQNASGDTTYALEGSAFIAGAAVQWIRDGLEFIPSSEAVEKLAISVDDTEGVVFVPALTGLGAPHWRPDAKGILTGLTRGTTKAHVARAVLEGVAFQLADIFRAMQKDLRTSIKVVRVDGGASANNFLMQFQCDLLSTRLERPKNVESTSMGAVFAAGLGLGVWSDLSAIQTVWKKEKSFQPKMSNQLRKKAEEKWQKALRQTLCP